MKENKLLSKLTKNLSDRLFRIANPFAENLRPLDGQKVQPALRGYCSSYHGLATARRPVQEDALIWS